MSLGHAQFMRLIVFFALPTRIKEDKRAYVLFRRILINDGYDMLQWSVYGRIVNGLDAEKNHNAFRREFRFHPLAGFQ